MLNNSTIDIGVNLSEVLTEQGLKLVPKTNTLINELSAAIANSSSVQFREHLDLQSVKYDLETASKGDDVTTDRAYVASEHDTYMDNYIDELSALVGGHIDFARNVVNKEAIKLADNIQSNVNLYKYKEPEDFFNITYYKLPEVVSLDVVSSEVATFAPTPNALRGGVDDLNLLCLEDKENLSQYLLTGVEEEDVVITSWFASLGAKGPGYLFGKVNEFGLSIPDSIAYGLTNYLFYRHLCVNDGIITNESLPSVTRKATNNRNYFGSYLSNVLAAYKQLMSVGSLITPTTSAFSYFSDKQLDVVVYEESFAKLAEAGLTVDNLFGYLSSSSTNTTVTVADLERNKEANIEGWARTRGLYLIHLNNQRLDIFKHLTRKAFEDSLADSEQLTEAEKEMVSRESWFIKDTLVLGNEYIDKLTSADMEAIDRLALDLVGRFRFRFSNAYTILSKMHELMAADDTLEPMEAALFSVITYLTDYALDQVEVIKFG